VDPLRPEAEERKDHKFEIVIRSDSHPVPGCPGVLTEWPWCTFHLTVGIDRLPLHGKCRGAGLRADGHIEKGIVCGCDRRIEAGVPFEKPEHHAGGFILDR
jgi:hypothetical protein